MIRKTETLAITMLLVAVSWSPGLGQALPPTILEIDIQKKVAYLGDISDPSKLATDPNVTTPNAPKNFFPVLVVADIVAVNGQPAKGTYVARRQSIGLNPAPNPGQAIADTVRMVIQDEAFDILKPDGTPIGTIMTFGLGTGAPRPGAPFEITEDSFAIVGGTGAFLGARGIEGASATPQTIGARRASMSEDPANRRKYAGGADRLVFHVIPLSQPQIVMTSNGPAVTHSSDFALVTSSKPAAAGEILSAFATGLGPTVPGVDPGKPFPSSPPAVVNAPVQVTVNGNQAQVLAAVGFPGAVDAYQVNFQVPPGTTKGPVTVQVTAAWIAGPAATIAVQ